MKFEITILDAQYPIGVIKQALENALDDMLVMPEYIDDYAIRVTDESES